MKIQMHNEKGLNPRITVCTGCGKDVGVAILGNRDKTYECRNCHVRTLGWNRGMCPRCGGELLIGSMQVLPDNDKIPDLCDDCNKKFDADRQGIKDEIEAGGVYFRCKKCKGEGVIKRDSKLAIEVRKKHNGPVGIELEECPSCQKHST